MKIINGDCSPKLQAIRYEIQINEGRPDGFTCQSFKTFHEAQEYLEKDELIKELIETYEEHDSFLEIKIIRKTYIPKE